MGENKMHLSVSLDPLKKTGSVNLGGNDDYPTESNEPCRDSQLAGVFRRNRFVSVHDGSWQVFCTGLCLCPWRGLLVVHPDNPARRQAQQPVKREGRGRPPKNLDKKLAQQLQSQGKSLREIAKIMGCGKTSVFYLLRRDD